MSEQTVMPAPLRRLAIAWVIVGILSVLGSLRLSLELGVGTANIGILGLLFGTGLGRGWRWVLFAIRGITWFLIVITFFFTVGAVTWFNVPGWVCAGLGVVLISLLLEQLHIIKRPEVQAYWASIKQPELRLR